jgi:Flp pilus assembly protein TadD
MSIPRWAGVAVSLLGLGCASAPVRSDRAGITRDELLAGTALGIPEDVPALVDEAEVLAVSPGMQAFLDAHVARGASRAVRVRQLASAIVDASRFGLVYDETTRTAPETFRTRRGNCLSFSSMFVAMARRVGLDARYQEVDVPPDWSFRDDTFVLNRHVNVLVDLGSGGSPDRRLGSLVRSATERGGHVVDFNLDDFRTAYDRRLISDGRALAHFYNNLAVERMGADDTASALAYFRRAARHDPLFSPAWTNLGILYLRGGHPGHAEAAYLQALKAEGGDLVAMSNLASLYERQADAERAAAYRSRVAGHRQRNPYYRYQLAREAFEAEDYDAAIGHLDYAIRRKKNEDRFYLLLGLCTLKKGDEREALRWLARAREVAATDALRRRYESKIDVLLSASADEKQR